MNAQISEEVHALCRRYQALALNEDPTTLTIALNEEAPQGCWRRCVSPPASASIWNIGRRPGWSRH